MSGRLYLLAWENTPSSGFEYFHSVEARDAAIADQMTGRGEVRIGSLHYPDNVTDRITVTDNIEYRLYECDYLEALSVVPALRPIDQEIIEATAAGALTQAHSTGTPRVQIAAQNMFATPESMDELTKYLEGFNGHESVIATTCAIMAWNLAAKITN